MAETSAAEAPRVISGNDGASSYSPVSELLTGASLRSLAIDAVSDAVIIAQLDGTIVDVNAGFTQVSGYSRDEAIGQPHQMLLGAGVAPDGLAEALRQVLRGSPWHGELVYRHRSGREYLGRVTVGPLSVSGGRPTHFVSLHRDITRYRKAEEAQRRLSRNVLRIIERFPDAIAVVKAGRVSFVNQAMAALFGHARPEDSIDASFADLVAPQDRALTLAALVQAAATEEALEAFEARLQRRDGSAIHGELSLVPLRFDDEPAVAVIVRDLSALRQVDLRARERDRMIAIGTLSAGIAHEINTPIQYIGDSAVFLEEVVSGLSAVLGRYRSHAARTCRTAEDERALAELRAFEEEMDAEYLESHAAQALERTRDGVSRVARIVRALKDFGHPGSDAPAPADLNQLVQNTLIVATNEIKYVADVETALGELPPVTCFASAINQVLLNLIVNAAHAIGDRVRGQGGRGTIKVETRAEGTLAHVIIRDTGTGIPEAVRARVFDPFFTTKEVGRGTGQGLAIARSAVVDRHGGRIWFDTETGVGTSFHFVLPIGGPERT